MILVIVKGICHMRIFTHDRVLTPSWDLLAPSVELLKKNIWQVVYLAFIPGILLSVGLVMVGEWPYDLSDSRTSMGAVILLIGALYSIISYPAYVYMLAKAAQGMELSIPQCLRAGLKRFFPLVGTGLLAGLAIICGFIALIVPGLILMRAFYLASYYVVDKDMGPIDALKQSWTDSQPVTIFIWGVIGVAIVFAIAGSIFGRIPAAGPIIAQAIALPYAFAPALRYSEIVGRIKSPVTVKASIPRS